LPAITTITEMTITTLAVPILITAIIIPIRTPIIHWGRAA
jgi:hypothetical protein